MNAFVCLLRTSLFFVVLIALAGCSSINTSFIMPGSEEESTEQDAQDIVAYEEVEPAQELQEELAALENMGIWDDSWRTSSEDLSSEGEAVVPPAVTFDFPVTVNKQVQFYLDLFQGRQHKTFARWLARSGKYLPMIEKELDAAGLPLDLAYLAMIESGYNPSAYSRAHAAGLWQFIRGTGRNYGLQIDSWVDERRDPEKATKAAVEYLSRLYEMFDDWHLAVAAYNAGEGKIERAIKRYKSRDFWQIAQHKYLRLETKRYVPKLIAAILIAKEPEKYGFADVVRESPVEYDVIKVPARTDLSAVAASAGVNVKQIQGLNNDLKKGQTPSSLSAWEVRIPRGSHDMVAANLKRLHPVVTTGYKTHVVRKGDTLGKICRTYNLNKTTLLKANNLRFASLKNGQRLQIPYRTTKYVLLKEGESPESRFASAGKDGRMVLHPIKNGETLGKISRLYNVPPEIIMQWNGLQSAHRIRAGQHLALYLNGNGTAAQASQAKVSVSAAAKKTVPNKTQENGVLLLAGGKKHRPDAAVESGEKTPQLTYYRVKNGDSLWTIARKFQISAAKLRQWNSLGSNMIHPGKQLIVGKS